MICLFIFKLKLVTYDLINISDIKYINFSNYIHSSLFILLLKIIKIIMSENSLVGNQDQFKKLVQLIDKLWDVGLSEHISMPRIAVLGS